MAPDALLIVAAGRRLPTLEELAECAAPAGDRIERLRIRTARGWRSLSDEEFRRLRPSARCPAGLTQVEKPHITRARPTGPPTEGGQMPDRRALAAPGPALDSRQAETVAAPPGPLLVLAGTGSGKTRVLTERAAVLVARHGQPAEALLVIKFTNRAAAELRSRLAVQLGPDAERMTVGTFHAVCHRLLRAHAERARRSPRFSIYDGQASRRLVGQALKELGAGDELPLRLVALQIGKAKARLLGPDEYRALLDGEQVRLVAAAYERYERALERSDALDFDDVRADGALTEHYDA
jgi:DNA helicase II / ATP-dependent DNA helicase PcrA